MSMFLKQSLTVVISFQLIIPSFGWAETNTSPPLSKPKSEDKSYKYASATAVEKYSKAGGKYNTEGLLQQYFLGLAAISLFDMRFKRLHVSDSYSYGNDCGTNVTPNPQFTIARAAGAAYLFGDISANWTFRRHAVKAGCLATMIKIEKEKKAEKEGGPKAKTTLGEECDPFEAELKKEISTGEDFQTVAFASVRDVLAAQEKALKKKLALAKLASLGFAASATVEAINLKKCNASCIESKKRYETIRASQTQSFIQTESALTSLKANAVMSGSPAAATACGSLVTLLAEFEKNQLTKSKEEIANDLAYKKAKAKKTTYYMLNLASTLYPIAGEFKKTADKKRAYDAGEKVKKEESGNVASVGYTTEKEWSKDPGKALSKVWKDAYLLKTIYETWKGKKKVKKVKDYEKFLLRESALINTSELIDKSLKACQAQLKLAVTQAAAQSTMTAGAGSATLIAAKTGLAQSLQVGFTLGDYLAKSYNFRYTPISCCGGQGVGASIEKLITPLIKHNQKVITSISTGSANAILAAEFARQKQSAVKDQTKMKTTQDAVKEALKNITSRIQMPDKTSLSEDKEIQSNQKIIGSLPWLSKSGVGGFGMAEDVEEKALYKTLIKDPSKTSMVSPLSREAMSAAVSYFEGLLYQSLFDEINEHSKISSLDTLELIRERTQEIDQIMFHFRITVEGPGDNLLAKLSDPKRSSILTSLLDQFFIPRAHAEDSGQQKSLYIALLIVKRIFNSIDTNHPHFKDKGWAAIMQGFEKFLKMDDILRYSLVYGGLSKPRNRVLFWSILSGATVFSINWTKKGLDETRMRKDYFEKKIKQLKGTKDEKDNGKDDSKDTGDEKGG